MWACPADTRQRPGHAPTGCGARAQVCARLAALTGGAGLGAPLTASDVAAALAVPLAVAGEHLAAAEARGTLCRDDGPEGLRFFRNFFADAQCAAG